MTTPVIIDSLVNAMGLAGVLALILALRRRDAPGGMRWRWTLALGLVAVMYASRGLEWLGGGSGFAAVTMAAAAVIPLAILLVVEGLIRRHAPLSVKLLVLTGVVAVLVVIASAAPWAGKALGIHIGIGMALAVATALAGMRGIDRAELRTIAALAACQVALIPAALSDFREFWPDMPARLSPLAVMLFGWVGLTIGSWSVGQRMAWLGFLSGVAALSALGLAQVSDHTSWLQIAVVILSTLMLVTICAEAITRPDAGLKLRRALVAAAPGDRDALVQALTASPIFGNGVMLSQADLADLDPAALHALFVRYPMLSRRDAPWGLARDAILADAIGALLDTHAATHLLIVESAPLALLAVNLPALSASDAVETDLALVQRLLRAAHRKDRP